MKQAQAFPLDWPTGWPRTPAHAREDAKFRTGAGGYRGAEGERQWRSAERVSVATGTRRVTDELDRMRARGIVVSTNLALRQDGLPRSGQREPDDSGAAVYWTDRNGKPRAMAIDRYRRIADNLAAIGATLDAMRGIERWGGATILERAFSGFVALPAPSGNSRPWWIVLGLEGRTELPTEEVTAIYKRLRSEAHPDKPGGSADRFNELAVAFDEFAKSRGLAS